MASILPPTPKRGLPPTHPGELLKEIVLPPTHPGELLKEIVLPALKAAGTSTTAVAGILGLSRPSFYEFLAGKTPVTAELALKLGKLCGNGPDLWLNMQKAWDLDRARAKLGDSLDAIPTLKVA